MPRSVLLLELSAYNIAGAAVVPLYLSDLPYTTAPSDTPASQTFAPVLVDPLSVRRRVQGIRGGVVQPSVGEIRADNSDGRLDAWTGYAFDGRTIIASLGPVNGGGGGGNSGGGGGMYDPFDPDNLTDPMQPLIDALDTLTGGITTLTNTFTEYSDAIITSTTDMLRPPSGGGFEAVTGPWLELVAEQQASVAVQQEGFASVVAAVHEMRSELNTTLRGIRQEIEVTAY